MKRHSKVNSIRWPLNSLAAGVQLSIFSACRAVKGRAETTEAGESRVGWPICWASCCAMASDARPRAFHLPIPLAHPLITQTAPGERGRRNALPPSPPLMGTPAGPFSTARAGEVEKAEEVELEGRATRAMAAERRASEREAMEASML